MALSFYILLWIGGGNDLIASFFDWSINAITWFLRGAIVVVPPLGFIATKRICLGLQRRDRDSCSTAWRPATSCAFRTVSSSRSTHPSPTRRRPCPCLPPDRAPLPMPQGIDENGVRQPGARKKRLQAKLRNFLHADNIPLPTRAELEAAEAHLRHEVEEAAPVMAEDRRPVPAHDGSVFHDPVIDDK
ncbi:MAG: hypothetical protein IPG68_14695 [Micrococcales bacterium]|nr:hypothetical protein [Micrococcales bacterium]